MIVTDGFTGNVALKTAEGTAGEILSLVKAAAKRNPLTMAGGLLLRGGVRDLRTRLDPETYGGAFLLGLAGISVAAHGSSSRRAIANACRMAAEGVRHDVCGHVAARVGREAARASAGVSDRLTAHRTGSSRGPAWDIRPGRDLLHSPGSFLPIWTVREGGLASREEVFEQVREILVERLDVKEDDVNMGAHLRDDLEADSLDLVELIMDLEERFGVKISDEEAQSITTVGEAVDFISERAD